MRISTTLLVLLSIVFCILVTEVPSQNIRRPSFFPERGRRQAGTCTSCIRLKDCPVLLRRLATRTRTAIYSVKEAICGFDGENSKVCCPVPEPPVRRDLLPRSCGLSVEFVRIHGGRNTSIGLHPWVAALGYIHPDDPEIQFHCAGSLINERYILTAAHCLDPGTLRGRRLVEIRLGDWDLKKKMDCQMMNNREFCAPPFIRVLMESAVIHPTYGSRFQYSDDIALIRLTQPLNLEEISQTIQPVCLPPTFAPGQLDLGQNFTAVGWGMTEEGKLSDVLQQVELPIVEGFRCRNFYGSAFGDNQICAGGLEGKDTCSGDSGGPLITSRGPPYQQVGIVSFGLAVCGTNNTPAVYTNVREYKTWILQNLKP